MSENAASSRRTATRSLVLCALMAALTAICSQIQIPLPMVPINLALFAVHLSGALLGWKYGALSMVVYALLGVIGVPVFAGFGSGPAVLFGKTGGYILGYILCALIVGALSRKFAFNFKTLCLSMVLGVAVCYAFGTIWFMAVTGLNLATSMSYCVIPFLPGDAVKILLAAFLALRLRKPLAAQGFAAQNCETVYDCNGFEPQNSRPLLYAKKLNGGRHFYLSVRPCTRQRPSLTAVSLPDLFKAFVREASSIRLSGSVWVHPRLRCLVCPCAIEPERLARSSSRPRTPALNVTFLPYISGRGRALRSGRTAPTTVTIALGQAKSHARRNGSIPPKLGLQHAVRLPFRGR